MLVSVDDLSDLFKQFYNLARSMPPDRVESLSKQPVMADWIDEHTLSIAKVAFWSGEKCETIEITSR